MTTAIQLPLSLRRLASLSLFAATILSLSNLPAAELPPPWLLAFTIPGAIIGYWSRLERPRWLRVLFAIILQASACYGALQWVGPMSRPAALACTILPPLAFATSRNHDGDPSLALFLSFCVMLVGVILDGVDMRLLLAYGAASFLSLHVATLLQGYRSSKPSSTARQLRAADVMATSMMMLSCIVAVFAIDRTLSCLPSPSRGEVTSDSGGANENRQVGLDDTFILDGGGGILSELTGEQLARASHPNNAPVASDIYLRCGFFTDPSMDRWHRGKLRLRSQTHADGHVLRERNPNFATERLSIERFGGATKFVFLPPNSLQVRGLSDLRVDPLREWLRPMAPNDLSYVVSYQELPDVDWRTKLDPRASNLGMTELPAGLNLRQFDELLEKWRVGNQPIQAMAAIADGLANHCQYSRREPVGPYAYTIENFLFADTDRHGYCMHFASAAALLLRMRGIPCRIGVGLYGGSPDRETEGARMFGSQHAHAWVEVMFEGHGFTIFDPTPPSSRGQAIAPEQSDQPTSNPRVTMERSVIEKATTLLSNLIATPATWAVLLAVVILLTLVPRGQPKAPIREQVIAAPRARRALQKLLRALAKAGHRRIPGQTIELFARDLADRERLPVEVFAAFATYQEVRFGGREFDRERAERMAQGLRAANAMAAGHEFTLQPNGAHS